jgi:hypothetical protein
MLKLKNVIKKVALCTAVPIAIIFCSCSKNNNQPNVTKTGIQWTFKGEIYTGDSASYLNGAYLSFDVSLPQGVNEVLISFSTANIKSGVYPVINGVFQKLTATNCYIGLLANSLSYNSTGSSGSVTVTNAGNTSTISFSNVSMLASGSDSSILSGQIITLP